MSDMLIFNMDDDEVSNVNADKALSDYVKCLQQENHILTESLRVFTETTEDKNSVINNLIKERDILREDKNQLKTVISDMQQSAGRTAGLANKRI